MMDQVIKQLKLQIQVESEKIKVFTLDKNRGKGYALKLWIKNSNEKCRLL